MFKDEIIEMMIKAIRNIKYEKIINEGKSILGKNPTGDETLVFDKMIEAQIADSLAQQGFEGEIRGEEKEIYGGKSEKGVILIDPVDGSRNALRGIPFYATLIGYAEKDNINSISRAVIYAPALNKMYIAIKGQGAYLLMENKKTRLTIPQDTFLKPLIEVVSNYTLKYTNIIRKLGKIRKMGSIGLAIVMAAEGALDAVIDIGKISRVTDTAPSLLVLSEAGGRIILDKNSSLNPRERINFIAGKQKLVNEVYYK